ncbi:MAG: hypothetical protein RSD04_05120 [Clostridia bacterium]
MKARDICLVALMSASITAGKMALAALPNIEIVTLLFVVYTLSLGWKRTFLSSIVFVMTETIIWGFGSWVLLYFVYWPSLVCLVGLCAKGRYRVLIAVAIGIVMTVFFGVLSTFIELSFMGAWQTGNFWLSYKYRYISGAPFFLTHIACNTIALPCLVFPLAKLISKINRANVTAKITKE